MSRVLDNSASRFKQRIKLERPVISQDSIGDTLTTWVLVDEVWADVSATSAIEANFGRSLREVVTYQVYLRWRDDVRADWRMTYNGQVFRILSVVNVDEENKLLKLKVEINS